jgi:hypothetical protein
MTRALGSEDGEHDRHEADHEQGLADQCRDHRPEPAARRRRVGSTTDGVVTHILLVQ